MVTFEMVLLTVEMTEFGLTRNESVAMWRMLSHLENYRINDPRMIIPKKNIWKFTYVKTLSISTRYLKNLEKHGFIELNINKDSFNINIMPFFTRIDELQEIQDKRMKKLSCSA